MPDKTGLKNLAALKERNSTNGVLRCQIKNQRRDNLEQILIAQ
jgi:hypothetical protein